MAQRILIVDDEEKIRTLLSKYARHAGYESVEAGDGRTAVEICRAGNVDMVILDVMMPVLDGHEALRAIRTFSDVPVLMLSARGEEYDKVRGFKLGVDDYVVKPFSVRELMLRIKAILRRGGRAAENALLERHGIRLRPDAHTASSGERKLVLTATEFRLLEDLLRHAGTVRPREQLLNNVWGYSFDGYARTVDTHVRRLRSKLGEAAAALETVRGVGYRIRE